MNGNSFGFPFVGINFGGQNQLDQYQQSLNNNPLYIQNYQLSPSPSPSNIQLSSVPSPIQQNQNDERNKTNAKKVTHACALCKKDHASCDSARPCKRCLARGIPEQCVDAESKKRGRKKINDGETRSKKRASTAIKEELSVPSQVPKNSQQQTEIRAPEIQFTSPLPLAEAPINPMYPITPSNNYPSQPNRNTNILQTPDASKQPYRNNINSGPSLFLPTNSSSFTPQQSPISPNSTTSSPLQLSSNNSSYQFSSQLSSPLSLSSQKSPLPSHNEVVGAYVPQVTQSSRTDNNNNLYENFMDVLNEDNNEKPGDFMWLIDQMIPNYLQQSSSEESIPEDLSFLFSPNLSQKGNLFPSNEFSLGSTLPQNSVDNSFKGQLKRPRTPSYLKVEGLQMNPSIVTPPEKESYDPAYETEQPPSLSIRSNETVFTMMRIMAAKGVLSEDEIYDHFNKLRVNADKIQDIREGISPEQKQAMKKDFDGFLNSFKNGAAQIGVPGMIWDRSGVVHYVNQSFIDMTGFSMRLPSAVDDYALLQIFSSAAIREYTKFMRDNYFQPTVVKKILATGLKVWKKESLQNPLSPKPKTSISSFCEGPYIEGTMCITIKRDVLGLPMIMFGHFLPSANSIQQLHL